MISGQTPRVCREGKPVPTPHQVRGRLFPDHALVKSRVAAKGHRRHPTHQISASLFKVARKLKLRFPTRVVPNTSARSSAKVPENPLVTSCPANSGRTKRSAKG